MVKNRNKKITVMNSFKKNYNKNNARKYTCNTNTIGQRLTIKLIILNFSVCVIVQ